MVFNATYDLLHVAEAAIVASGTATLEAALLNVPQAVVYMGHPISITIARMVVKIKFISLVNLIMNQLVVKELIQADCSVKNITDEINLLVNNKDYRATMLTNYDQLDIKMGKPGASSKTAGLILKYIKEKELKQSIETIT